MPRNRRVLLNGGYYHLIARGNNRVQILREKDGFKVFRGILKSSKTKFSWKLLHYCLMTNHFHLLGQIEIGKALPKLMQFLLFEYSRWYRKETKYVGHVWQGRYKSPLITEESYLLECGRYIERNPLRAELVQCAEDYPWSSYGYYALGWKDELLDEDPFYHELGRNAKERQGRYRSFIKIPGPYEPMIDSRLLETHF